MMSASSSASKLTRSTSNLSMQSLTSETKAKSVGIRKKGATLLRSIGNRLSKTEKLDLLETKMEQITSLLKKSYKDLLLPLEKASRFDHFYSMPMNEAEFNAIPTVLVIGQYSTGKTTLIRHLVSEDFPGMRIGPEPTTDNFSIITYGKEQCVIPGNALVVDQRYQYAPLAKFGCNLLNRLQLCHVDSPLLKQMTLIDTPGVLSGEKQRLLRGYDYIDVIAWFAQIVDRILILFDANKLDISDELRGAICALKGHEDKIRIVLNKADCVNSRQLMRCYGALMWSLGKVLHSPEVVRVFIGSFMDNALVHDDCRDMFLSEQADLFQDLRQLPRQAAVRKINDFIKRFRSVRIQALIMTKISKSMHNVIRKDRKKKEIIENLDKIFVDVQRLYHVSSGDFPDVNKYKEKLRLADWSKFKSVDVKWIIQVDQSISQEVSKLMKMLPDPAKDQVHLLHNNSEQNLNMMNGPMDAIASKETPFANRKDHLEEYFQWQSQSGSDWPVSNHPKYPEWISEFNDLQPNGIMSGNKAKKNLIKSKLPNSILSRVWTLSDVNADGRLSRDEFCLAKYLIELVVEENQDLPKTLPDFLKPL